MSTYERWSLIVQGLTGVAIVATFGVYYFQLRALRDGSRAQNMLAIASFLQRQEVRDARGFVIQTLEAKPYQGWDQSDRQQASVVCSSFDTACIFVKEGLYPQKLFFDTYGPSLRKCYAVLRPFIEDMQRPEMAGSRYWDDFVDLANASMLKAVGR